MEQYRHVAGANVCCDDVGGAAAVQVAHDDLTPGTVLTATLKGQIFSASVVIGSDGKPEVEFSGQRHASLSAAGKAAAGANRRFMSSCSF